MSRTFVRTALHLLFSLGLLGGISAHAQWQWVDAQGRKVFSDKPPPEHIPEQQILKRPGAPRNISADSVPEAKTPPKTAASAAKPVTELDRKARELKAQEDAAQKAQKEKEQRQMADNCEQARKSLATLQASGRIHVLNAKGEQDFMSDQTRHAESQRLQQYIGSNCNR
jgi:monoamine oxidase